MKTVSKTFELQTLKLPQLPLGLPLQGFMLQGQSHAKYDFFKANSAENISCATPV